jgi:recombination protein RecA
MAKAKKTDKQDGAKVESMADYPPLEFITTGVPEIDAMVHGYAKGRVTEIFGKTGVGKSTLMMYMLAAISQDHKVLYIDAENALNIEWLKGIGADPTKVDFSTCSVLEDVGQLILDSLNTYQVIILDSVAQTITRTEAQSDIGDHVVGVKGKVMNSIFSRRLPEIVAKSNCALILINQLRDSFSMYGGPTYTPGGKAIGYAASLRLQLNTVKSDLVVKDKVKVGHNVTVTTIKTKQSKPHAETRFFLKY